MNTSEVLNRAADEIERRGWVGPGDFPEDNWGGGANSSAPLCLEGGILAALGMGSSDQETAWLKGCSAYGAVKSYLVESDALDKKSPLYFWNDEWERTATEVVEVLRAVAVIEAAREQQPAGVSS